MLPFAPSRVQNAAQIKISKHCNQVIDYNFWGTFAQLNWIVSPSLISRKARPVNQSSAFERLIVVWPLGRAGLTLFVATSLLVPAILFLLDFRHELPLPVSAWIYLFSAVPLSALLFGRHNFCNAAWDLVEKEGSGLGKKHVVN